MDFAGANYIAIVVAAIAAFVFGAAYYGVLGKPWMKAARIEPKDGPGMPPPSLLINSIICELIMAWVLAGVIGHLGDVTIRTGLISGVLLWLGFIATTQAVNHRYQGFGWNLTVIDSIHWLIVMLLMGGIIGAFGI